MIGGLEKGVTVYCEHRAPDDCSPGEGLITLGILTFAGGTIYDLATASSAARAYNRERGLRSLAIAPVLTPHQTGLAISGAF